ncbi:MAG TPA: hypothetical protein VGL61_16630 [Kofleriaceae bacterium]|jgi:hypothetical protein
MSKLRRTLALAGLAAWLVIGTAVGGALLIRHLVPLPAPPRTDTALRDAVRELLPQRGWRAVHVMYRDCPCSQRTIAHLLASQRPAELAELVLIVDDDRQSGPEDPRLRAAGFPVSVIAPDELRDRFHLEAAPVLIVMSPEGELAYVGGYNRHKQSAAYEDAAIVADVRARHDVAPLPVFGCATSARLANEVDPLHLGRAR